MFENLLVNISTSLIAPPNISIDATSSAKASHRSSVVTSQLTCTTSKLLKQHPTLFVHYPHYRHKFFPSFTGASHWSRTIRKQKRCLVLIARANCRIASIVNFSASILESFARPPEYHDRRAFSSTASINVNNTDTRQTTVAILNLAQFV